MSNPTINQAIAQQRKRTWSQLAFDFVVKLLDGRPDLEVRSSIADAIQWERNHGGTSFMSEKPSTGDLMWLAWAAATRQGKISDDFDLFVSKIADFAIDPISWEGAPSGSVDPTPAAPWPTQSPD